jgi:choline kinase
MQGRRRDPYEEAIRDVLLTSQRRTFSFEDITGMPWIEIDFAADVERATCEILPRILAAEGSASAMMRRGGETGRSLEQGL